jgi:hypothetical protein
MARKLSDQDRQMFAVFMDRHTHCWACGWQPGLARPVSQDIWAAPQRLENHHIIGGSGRKHIRPNIARLCSLCHRLFHGDRIRVNGELLPELSMGNILYLKLVHDPRWYKRDELDDLTIGLLPTPEMLDDWFTDGWKARQGGKR